jgi:hypothetical protein
MQPECACPAAYPPWQDEDVDLGGQCVFRTPIPSFLHMPIAYELQLERQQRSLQQLGLRECWPGLAFIRTGMFGGAMLRLIEDTASLSRHVSHLPSPYRVRARLHPGGIGSLRQTVREVQASLLDHGRMPKELWLAHLTCPRCADARGGEKILLLRHWTPSPRLRRGQDDRN